MTTMQTLLALFLAGCILVGNQPALVHAGAHREHPHHVVHHRKLQQTAFTSPDIEAAAVALLNTAHREPPEMPAATEADATIASNPKTLKP
jgi:hypothetical protein